MTVSCRQLASFVEVRAFSATVQILNQRIINLERASWSRLTVAPYREVVTLGHLCRGSARACVRGA
jgi:hypothetical protein